MNEDSEFLEEIWGEILSRDPVRINQAFTHLDTNSQIVVYEHLNKMVSEEGWQEIQITSARQALQALGNNPHD